MRRVLKSSLVYERLRNRETELTVPPGNRLERLKGDRVDQYSIRINQQ